MSEYRHISGNGTWNLSQGPGTIERLIINNPDTAGGGVMTIYDGQGGSGNILGVVNLVKDPGPQNIDIFARLRFALSVVVTGNLIGDFTITYRQG